MGTNLSVGFHVLLASGILFADEPARIIPMNVPQRFRVVRAASAPLVERPMFAALDATGALYVLDSGGVNGKDRAEKPPDVIRRLADTNGDGVYDKSEVFADNIVFGTGLVWYDNAVFVTSPPSLWKFEDTNADGIADKRTELVTGFAFNQSCSDDLHGACLGPDGRIYFLPGRFPHKVRVPGGPVLREGLGPWLMRCRPDGRDVEFVSGTVGNPVEVTFLPTGDAFLQGTFWAKPSAGGGLRDALIHAVPGGEYSVRDRDYQDRVRTGDFLPALVPHPATAPSGLTSYQSETWGNEYRHNLFTSHFNTGKILRHRLTREGGTFAAETGDFVTPTQEDVHLTDVLEDADGSLLVVDTGGWFRACCPASGTSKPDVYGAIYRISRDDMPTVLDPCGNGLEWEQATVRELVERLKDRRFAVRERATSTLSKRGDVAIQELAEVLKNPDSPLGQRQNAVWTLCRMEEPKARAAVRIALMDPTDEVRQAAANIAALHRDQEAQEKLTELLRDPSPGVRREAAHALGRIGRAEAVPPLLEAIASQPQGTALATDRFLEHALIYSLICINDPAGTRRGLEAGGFAERRAALIALDQMSDGHLQPSEVAPLLSVPDPELQRTAINILTRHPQWTGESIRLIETWLGEKELDEARVSTLVGIVRTLRDDKTLRQVIDRRLATQNQLATPAQRALMLELAGSGVRDVSPAWREGIRNSLHAPDADVRLAALKAVEGLTLKELADDLHGAANDPANAAALRLAAIRSLTALPEEITEGEFAYLLTRLSPDHPIQQRLAALDIVAQSAQNDERLRKLLPLVREANPIELPSLLKAFSRGTNADVGRALVTALSSSSVNPASELVAETLKPYGAEVLAAAGPLLARLKTTSKEQVARLDELETILERHEGNASRGRELFFGKAQCHLCHTVAGRGGKVGPDLSAIGEIRSRRDLLEAVAIPSAAFARGFEPVIVALTDGRVVTGLAGRESADELVLNVVQDNKPIEVPLRREAIEQVKLGQVSPMPSGLDRQLQPSELSDLVRFLQHLRTKKPGADHPE